MIQFTAFVGTSPGTTTMELPALNDGLGYCQPGYYASNASAPLPTAPLPTDAVTVNPYGTESKLMGLGATSKMGLFALMFGLAFASVLGVAAWRARR